MCEICKKSEALVTAAADALLKEIEKLGINGDPGDNEKRLTVLLVEEAAKRAFRITDGNVPTVMNAMLGGIEAGLRECGADIHIQGVQGNIDDDPIEALDTFDS